MSHRWVIPIVAVLVLAATGGTALLVSGTTDAPAQGGSAPAPDGAAPALPNDTSRDKPGAARRPREHAAPEPKFVPPPVVSAEAQRRAARERVAVRVFEVLDSLLSAEAARRTDGRTFADARRWAANDLYAALWKEVGDDLKLPQDELEAAWKGRAPRDARWATYGRGSFLVVKQANDAGTASSPSDAE